MTPDVLASALDGDRSELRSLIDHLTRPIRIEIGQALHRRGRRAGRDARQEIDDMVQEVFLRLLANDARILRAWDPARGRGLSGYVRMVARSQVATIMRSARRNPWTEDPTAGEALEEVGGQVEDHSHRYERADALHRLLARLEAQLDERGMLLFRMLWVEECSVEEACAATGMSREALYVWRSRLRKRAAALAREQSGPQESGRRQGESV